MFFNNCVNRDHQKLFGPGAFFDLEAKGSQAALALGLQPGDICIVARYGDKERTVVDFSWYSFTEETNQIDEKGTPARVLRGVLNKSESLSKIEAACDARYQHMFDKNGNFKRPSVLKRPTAA